jgi:methylated-DNA-[protein]-cysteine S-methyltransferase
MSRPQRFALFSTAIGECALAWSDAGLTGVWLPETAAGALRRKLSRRLPDAREEAPSPEVAAVIDALGRALAGAPVDLREVRLDLARTDAFQRRVYAVARAIAPGRVLSYAAVAERVGGAASPRAVGQALGANPFPIVVPCHRVVAASGRLGGFSAPGGTALKRRLLAIENARPEGPPGLFDAEAATDSSRAGGA